MSTVNILYQEDQEEFSQLPGINILVFGSKHCGVCRAAKPEIMKMLNKYEFNVGFVELSNPEVKVKGLRDIPSFIIYRDDETPVYIKGFDREYIEEFLE